MTSSSDFESTAKIDPTSESLLTQKDTFLKEENECSIDSQQKLDSTTGILKKHVVLFLILFITILLLVITGLIAYIITETVKKHSDSLEDNNEDSNKCLTNTCYKASNFLMDNLNQTVDPCIDFYNFSCGSWEVNSFQEKDQFTIAYEKMLLFFSDILKAPIKNNSANGSRQKTFSSEAYFKQYYQSCINQTDVELNADRKFLNYMFNEIGEWPILPDIKNPTLNEPTQANLEFGTKSFFGFEKLVSKLTSLRSPFLLRFESHDFNNTKILMQLVVPQNFCKLQNFFPTTAQAKNQFLKLARHIRNYMFESYNGIEFNNNIYNNSYFEQQIEEMLELAKKIYFLNNEKYSCANRTSRTKIQNVLTMRELHDKLNANFSAFNFLEYIEYLNNRSHEVKLTERTQVVISSLTINYLNDLFRDIKSLNFEKQKLRRAFKNLIFFNLILSLVKPLEIFSTPHIHVALPIRYYHAFLEYSKMLNDVSPIENFRSIYRINREQNCAYSVIDAFSVVGSIEQVELQRLFLTQKFNTKSKNLTIHMLENLLNTTSEIINDQDWIDAKTKKSIFISLHNMEHRIVYSESIFDSKDPNKAKLVENEYKLSEHYIENVFILKKRSYQKEFDLLETRQSERIRSKKYVFDIFLANLMYLKEHNTMLMPAGMLIEPIFDVESPLYLNYATIGSYMAHEIWHMIHEELLNSVETTQNKYTSFLMCLHKNYVNYSKNKFGFVIDGTLSLSEQMADTFGILASYKSYLKELNLKGNIMDNSVENVQHKLLPGLKYNQEKLFFIRYSQSYCLKRKITKLSQFEQFHVIHQFRAFQPSLIPEFNTAFKCKSNHSKIENSESGVKSCNIFKIK